MVVVEKGQRPDGPTARKEVAFMIRYKVDVLAKLKEAGFTSYRLRKEKILGESVLTKLRNGNLLSWHELDIICHLLKCQPGDLVQHIDEPPADAE